MQDAPFDIVYTWVDDRFPGYLDQLNRYAEDRRDLNPNRTRDNLELLRFSMRSVARHLPEARRIYLVTCRPQVPAWLDADHPKIQLVHHDEIMSPDRLPTFSSFAIVSHLHLIPGLSERFFYFEDDTLANAPGARRGLQAPDGRPIVNLSKHWILPHKNLNPATSSPWNLALANVDAALSARFAPGPRRQVMHGPQLIERAVMAEALEAFGDLVEATRAARFRTGEGIAPEVLVPHYAVETGRAHLASDAQSRRAEGYVSLENLRPWTWAQLKALDRRKPLTLALNDSFGARPNARVEQMVRRWLEARFPSPAPWERA